MSRVVCVNIYKNDPLQHHYISFFPEMVHSSPSIQEMYYDEAVRHGTGCRQFSVVSFVLCCYLLS